MEAGTQEGQWLASLADFWMFEHLLSLPSSIASQEIINHIGTHLPYRESENGCMPAPVSARMFLRHMRTENYECKTLLQLLGLLRIESSKQHQFRSRAAAKSIAPPAELVTEVLLQCLCAQADSTRTTQGSQQASQQGSQQQVLTTADVHARAQELLTEADLEYLQDDEMLLNRLSLLEQLLRGCRDTSQLQRQLQDNFPADAVEEQLREYQDKALRGLGPTSLQMYHEDVQSGRLPAHPFQHFAAAMPISTQAYEALPDTAAAAEEHGRGHARGQQQQQQQQQQQRERGTGPVLLLPEATAPVLGTQELDAGPGSSDAKRAGRGGRKQQAAAAAASPKPKALPKPAAAAAAAAAGDGVDAEPVGRKARAAAVGQKAAKDAKQDAPAGGRPSRKQLHLEPTTATAAAAPAAAAAAGGGEQEEAPDAPAAAGGGKRGRRSRKQQQQPEAEPDSELIGTEAVAPAAAAGAGSGGRRRRLGAAAAAAAAAAGAEEEQEEEEGGEAQLQDGSQPNAADGVQPAAAAGSGAAAGKGRGIASAFMEVLAAVRGSPSGAPGRKSQKLCGAPEQGVRGKTVEWNSPLGGIDSPEDSPRGAAKQAAAAGSRPPGSALKRKRGHGDEGQRGLLAAAKAAGAHGVDSGNTEYEDAQEDAGSESEGARGARVQRGPGRKPQGGRKSRRDEGDDADDDSYIEDPESEESESQGAGEFDFDDSDDDLGGKQGQGRQQHGKQRSGGAAAAAAGRGGARAAGSKGAGAAAGAAQGAGGPKSRPVGVETFSDSDDAAEPIAGVKRRRKVQRWSKEEESLLAQLVARYGVGQWALIHTVAGDGLNKRTQVDLKDKWRNLSKKLERADRM